MRLMPVFILETHNPDEQQNVCPSSSRRKMRPWYKNGHWGYTVPGADPHTYKGGNRPIIYDQETVEWNLTESQISFYSNGNTPKHKKSLKLT